MNQVTSALAAFRPFVAMMAALCAIMLAWNVAIDLFPFLAQIWRPKLSLVNSAYAAAALALVSK